VRAAIPDLIEPLPQVPRANDAWARPLPVFLTDWWYGPMPLAARRPFELLVDGLPDDPDTMTRALAHYPTAAAARPKMLAQTGGVQRALAAEQSLPVITWSDRQLAWPDLEPVAPDYRGLGRRLLLPSVAGDALSPLTLWWVLWFGLSSIARYDPELWIKELDVNRSKLAVPIEAALDTAMAALSELEGRATAAIGRSVQAADRPLGWSAHGPSRQHASTRT
jgi:hypothetical protein